MHEDDESALFRNLSQIVLNADRPSAFLACICEYVNAKSGAIWGNTNTRMSRDIFILKAVFNRPGAMDLVGSHTFNLRADYSVSAIAFKQREPIIGRIGKEPFGSHWLSQSHTRDLQSLGVKYVAIVPVFNLDDMPSNALSLYFEEPPEVRSSTLKGLGELFSATNEAIGLRLNKHRQERDKDRHEVLAHAGIIKAQVDWVRTAIQKRITGEDARQLSKRIDDISRSAQVLLKSYDGIPFINRVEIALDTASYHNVRRFILDTARAAWKKSKRKVDVTVGDLTMEGGQELDILFAAEHLSILFGNIYDNAFKYAVQGSVVRTSVLYSDGRLAVSIRNEVNIDANDDLDQIWEYEVRGEASKQGSIPGRGIGLGLVSDICNVYDIEREAKYEMVARHRHTKVFCVTLVMPSSIVW